MKTKKNADYSSGFPGSHLRGLKGGITLNPQLPNNESTAKRRIILRKGNSFIPMAVDHIALFYSEMRITYAIDFNGNKYRSDFTISGLTAILNPSQFFGISRRMIVQINAIKAYSRIPFGKLSIRLICANWIEEEIVISQVTAPGFKRWIAG